MPGKVEEDCGVESVKTIRFHVGQQEHTVNADNVGPTTSLNSYLRNTLHLRSTKYMCYEGGCGACLVVAEEEINGKKHIFAVNSCLVSVYSCAGWTIHTNEGIGNPQIGFHNIQKLLASNNGTQCGFCSSGMVMNMYALLESGPVTQEQIENSFGGNICRCTGYRPILEAFKKLASDTSILPDIEEFQYCQKDNCKKNCPSCPNQAKNFCLEFADSKWAKVSKLADLLSILRTAETNRYMLVAGNTAKGVYGDIRDAANIDLYVDISRVLELTTYTFNNNRFTIGANTSLSNSMIIFESLSKNAGFAYLNEIKNHFDLIASVPVRNIGTIAGNLMIKYKHNEFSSDVFLVLEVFKATIVIVDSHGDETTTSAEAFLKLDMAGKVIKSIIFSPFDDSHKYSTYKIMPRAQNAHASVNAGFLFKLSNNVIQGCRIVYGGINSNFVHASKTEDFLKGQKLYDNSTLKQAYKFLDVELICDDTPPDASPAYRKNLAISLFYKFVLKTAPTNLVSPKNVSGGTILDRPVSSSRQEFGTQKANYPVSEPVVKLEALAQTSGQAEYIGDIPDQPHQLYAAFVTAEAPPGSVIQSTDASAALKMAGVVAYYDYKSIPGENNVMPANLGLTVVEPLFCTGKVLHYHQPVGIVVANQENLATEAANKVKIYYSSPSETPLVSIKDVLKANAKERITEGTTVIASKTGKDVKTIVKGTWYVGHQYHFHMETQCCLVIPTEDGLDMYPSTQWMDLTQSATANILKIPSNKINISVRRLGGAFGAKMFRNVFVSTATALAAHKLGKPVKMVLPLETNMKIIGKRYPSYIDYEVGVNDKGVFQYMNSNIYTDFGVGGNEPIDQFFIPLFENCYDYSTWNFSTNKVATDTPANSFMRAPGSLEGMGAIESIMEHISYVLNMDSMDVRLNNLKPDLQSIIPEYWKTMQSWGEIAKRKDEISAFNQANRWKKRGMSVVPMSWLLEITAQYPVLVSIYHSDGTVVISHGGIEMGQGINTKAAQVAAYKFGIALDKVSIKPSYNVIAANSALTGGSWTSEAIAYAIINACDTLLERMKPIKDKMENPTWEKVVTACFNNQILLSAYGFFSDKDPSVQKYNIYGVCATDVEIDILTGQQQILRVDILEDVGNSMSPLVDIGQCEGGFVLGMGYFTTEEIFFSGEGKLLNPRTWNYKPPGAKDIPLKFNIKFPDNNPNPIGVLKSKAIAEPPTCLSITVPLAIRNAVSSARSEADSKADKWFPFDGTTTYEKTFLNCLNSFDQYTL